MTFPVEQLFLPIVIVMVHLILFDLDQAMILRHYDEILTSCNALDYHDFISSSVKLLTDFPEGYYQHSLFMSSGHS